MARLLFLTFLAMASLCPLASAHGGHDHGDATVDAVAAASSTPAAASALLNSTANATVPRDYSLAFGLNIGAAAASMLGGGVIYVCSFRSRGVSEKSGAVSNAILSKFVLSASIGLAIGILLYTALAAMQGPVGVEFKESGVEWCGTASALCFSCGIITSQLLQRLAHCIGESHGHGHDGDCGGGVSGGGSAGGGRDTRSTAVVPTKTPADVELGGNEGTNAGGLSSTVTDGSCHDDHIKALLQGGGGYKAGISLALSMGIHNFSEGMVTFAVALSSKNQVSYAVAIAIVLHNIPEGYLVALPIYAETKSMGKALGWVFVTVLFEILAGFVVYAVVASTDHFDGEGHSFRSSMAVASSLAAGIMANVAVADMLPMCAALSGGKSKSPYMFILAGMLLMAYVMALFDIK